MLREGNAKNAEKSTVCLCNADKQQCKNNMNCYVTWYAGKNASKPYCYVLLLYRGRNPDKSFKSFPPSFFKLMQPLTYFVKLTQPLMYFYSSVTAHCKGERRKTL